MYNIKSDIKSKSQKQSRICGGNTESEGKKMKYDSAYTSYTDNQFSVLEKLIARTTLE